MVRREPLAPAVAFLATTLFSNVSATMSSGKAPPLSPWGGPIVRCGHVKKLKTQKKKYFVLRGEAPGYPACLEYYDSKKKFANRQPPKRRILLDSCFNINKRLDTKHKHVIALYTKDECFCLILESEKELDEWLNAMLLLQSGDVPDGEQPRPIFEHVWGVTVQERGLGERKSIHGPYRLCLTDKTLSLVKMEEKDNTDCIEFPLNCIRRCGWMDNIFYMEVGRSAITGGGDLWMEAEDNNIARNMHTAIMNAASNSNSNKDDVAPRQRMRSSSATESTKPIFVSQRKHAGQKFHNFSPLEEHRTHKEKVDPLQEQEQCSQTHSISSCNTVTGANGRDRCDSLPSRARTTSEGHPGSVMLGRPRSSHFVAAVPRPHSMYGRGLSYSPPVFSMPISPASGACSIDSVESSLSMDDSHSLTPEEHVILEENGDDYTPPNCKSHSPSQPSSDIDMYSPCGSSPGRGGCFLPRSFGTAHSHSRASSLVEETNVLPDGYVPMAPGGNNGYVDMDPTHNHNGHFPDDMSHGGSSCSVTSGTPSTDMRFSEYHLDKVPSYIPPGDDLARPVRAYSIGSRPDAANGHDKNRLDICQQDASRVRAFSVGSRSKKPELGRLINVVTAPLPPGVTSSNSTKSNSAPLLSSSWGHNWGCSVASERMEDLMELDFSRPFSTATDTSSYVDMSPGHPPSSTAPYVEMGRMNKINRNNNNNTIAANQNHSHMHVLPSVSTHKPVITTLKPVKEAEGPYMKMDYGGRDNWSHLEPSPKQISSPTQEESLYANGPPGGKRTAPMDLPRRPTSDYVEMNPNHKQDYINMNLGNRNNQKTRTGDRKDKLRSQPIEILGGNKPVKAPSFLPLNGSPESESLASTPASLPRATPTGSSATIFPFSLNSPQSPEKSFTEKDSEATSKSKDSDVVESANRISALSSAAVSVTTSTSLKVPNEELNSTVEKDKGRESHCLSKSFVSQDQSMDTLVNEFPDLLISQSCMITASSGSEFSGFKPRAPEPPSSPTSFENVTTSIVRITDTAVPVTTATASSIETTPATSTVKSIAATTVTSPLLTAVTTSATISTESSTVTAAVTTVLSTVTPMVAASTTTSPTSTATISTPASIVTAAVTTSTATVTTSSSSSSKSDGGEESTLHYASLDLPDKGNVPPVSPASQESFNYAEIDFTKLKQN